MQNIIFVVKLYRLIPLVNSISTGEKQTVFCANQLLKIWKSSDYMIHAYLFDSRTATTNNEKINSNSYNGQLNINQHLVILN